MQMKGHWRDRMFLSTVIFCAWHPNARDIPAGPFAYRTIDTHTLCYMHMIEHGIQPPVAKHRSALDLDRVLNYCGIPSEPAPHNALTGALSRGK